MDYSEAILPGSAGKRLHLYSAVFYIMGLIFIYRFNRTPLDKPAGVVNVYMMMRIIKIFVSFVILLFYWILDKNHIRNFAVIFIIFYVINLLLGNQYLPLDGK